MDSFNSENLMVEIYVQEQLWHPKPSPLPPNPFLSQDTLTYQSYSTGQY